MEPAGTPTPPSSTTSPKKAAESALTLASESTSLGLRKAQVLASEKHKSQSRDVGAHNSGSAGAPPQTRSRPRRGSKTVFGSSLSETDQADVILSPQSIATARPLHAPMRPLHRAPHLQITIISRPVRQCHGR